MHNLGDWSFVCKRFFATQHCRDLLACAMGGRNGSLRLPVQDDAMKRLWITALMLIATAGTVWARPPVAASPQGLLCRAAVASAERANGIPAHLLAAISRVESGRQ